MTAVTIRKAVSPDIELFVKFDHTVKTDRVWQMAQTLNPEKISTSFIETKLPRDLKLSYPRSPETLLQNWKNHSVILTACVEGKPIAYLSINTVNSRDTIWIKDLVVDETWRRQGVASTLYHAANQWGKSRKFRSAMMEMASKNYPAICLARKMGFEFTGFNDHYLENNDIALFFSRYLN
jgi:ribosomal protein S18 acetylase RimI-like enzyme